MNGVVLFDGIAYGMLLFLLAAVLSVTMGLMNFVNLAHGVFAMLGGYAAWMVMQYTNWGFMVAMLTAFLLAAAAGAVLERLLFRRLYGGHALDQVLLSIGVVFMGVAVATFAFGPSFKTIALPSVLQGQMQLAGMEVGRYRALLIIIGAILSLALWLGIVRTRFGARLRAAVDQPQVTAAMGINVSRLFFWTFALGSGLAGL